ncbi:hypothetical protein C9374_013329 [Naegleria lovaniensis]|uniref:Nucleoprotein TPR/MLP1 domain-containing protein n=1 Tax=Naegleria lovaniensis TaxID=51637 RepID=A0AA88GWJ5_NAELO|nr:uncharacterized protein C9374_013329 [Naegleria lovaniensis]KAG2391844.1 hypothetical protein C9374_013329 [Naegleria lovaniensis]
MSMIDRSQTADDDNMKLSFLSAEELEQFGNDPMMIKKKAQEYISKIEEELLECREELKTVHLSNESLLNKLEQQQNSKLEEYELLKERIEHYKTEAKNYQDQIEHLTKQVKDSERRWHEQRNELEQISSVNEELKAEKFRLLSSVEKKTKEIEDLNSHIESLNQKINEQYKIKHEQEEKIQEISTSVLPLKYSIEKLQQEKESLEKQNAWLNSELSSKQEQITKLKSEYMLKLNELEIQTKTKEDVITNLNEKISRLEQSNKEYNHKLQQKIEEIRDLKNSHLQELDGLNEELTNERRLSDLYKNRHDDLEDRIKDLEKSLSNVKEAKQRQESSFEVERESMNEQLRQSKEKIESLEVEIRKYQKDLEENIQLRASTFVTQGISPSDIYTKFVKVSDELLKSKNENKRLNEVLSGILKDLEEKAPIMQAQREEYEQLRSSYTMLTKQKQDLIQQTEAVKDELINLRAEAEKLRRSLKTAEQVNQDLSLQVRTLLKEGYTNSESSSRLDANAVITERLVPFADIDELQKRNVELLTTIRELASQKEEEARHTQEIMATEFQEKIQVALKQVEDLRRESQRQMEKIQSLIKQRDMYKSLLDEKSTQNSTSFNVSNPQQKDSQDSKTVEHLKLKEVRELQQEILKDKKLLQDEIAAKNEKITKLHSSIARLTSEVEFLKDSSQNMTLERDSTMRELNRIRSINDSLTKTIDALQTSMDRQRINYESKDEQLKRLEKELIQTKSEKLYHEQRSERLILEIDNLKLHLSRNEEFYSSLQKIQIGLEQKDENDKKRALQEIETCRIEISQLRQSLEDERLLSKELRLQIDLKEQEHREKLDVKTVECQKFRDEVTRLKTNYEFELDKTSSLQQKLNAAEERLNKLIEKQMIGISTSESTPTNINELQVQFSKVQNENVYLKESLENEKAKLETMKELAETNDRALKDMTDAFDKLKHSSESKISSLNQQIVALNEKIYEYEQELKQRRDEVDNIKQQLDDMTEQTKKEKQMVETVDSENKLNAETYEKRIEILKEDLRRHTQFWKDAQDKYEQELIRHAATIEAFKENKEELNKAYVAIEESKSTVKTLELELERKTASLSKHNEDLMKQTEEYEKRVKDLERQLELSFSRVEILNIQLKKIQTSTDIVLGSSSNDQTKEILELQETITFIRREKEMLKSKLAIAEQELKNTKQKLEHAFKELAQIQTELKTEIEKNQQQSKDQDRTGHIIADLQEQVQVFKESNMALRQQNEQLTRMLDQTREELKEARKQLAPLSQHVNELKKEKEIREEEIKSLQEDVIKYQNKAQHLVEKFKQIDPDVHEKLKQESSRLEKELLEKVETIEHLTNQLSSAKEEISKQVTSVKEHNQKSQD